MKHVLRRLRHELFATPGDGLLSVALLTVIALALGASCAGPSARLIGP